MSDRQLAFFECQPQDVKDSTLVMRETEERAAFAVLTPGVPDYIVLPKELGGSQVKVIAKQRGTCVCKRHSTVWFELEHTCDVCVCVTNDQFYWVGKRPATP
jgi:hypothetical protein